MYPLVRRRVDGHFEGKVYHIFREITGDFLVWTSTIKMSYFVDYGRASQRLLTMMRVKCQAPILLTIHIAPVAYGYNFDKDSITKYAINNPIIADAQ